MDGPTDTLEGRTPDKEHAVRTDLIREVRGDIDAGVYETTARIDAAAGAMLAQEGLGVNHPPQARVTSVEAEYCADCRWPLQNGVCHNCGTTRTAGCGD